MSQFPKVRILRLKERHGLIRARLAGAQNATGKKLPHFCFHHKFPFIYDIFKNTAFELIQPRMHTCLSLMTIDF